MSACKKTAPGRKIQKQRITFMLCANADGSNKIKPMMIGKAAKPRCFSGFRNPSGYDHSANAWMTSAIFRNWFQDTFVKQVRNNFIRVIYKEFTIFVVVCRYVVLVLKIIYHLKQFFYSIIVAHMRQLNHFVLRMEIFWQCSFHRM